MAYVTECLQSTWISSTGRFLDDFERRFADFCQTRHAIAVCNGTAALHLCLLAHGAGPGDEVIVPTLTFVSTANAVSYCGATPVLADCDPATFNICVEQMEELITPRTKGVVVTHLYGHAADCDPIREVARRHGLFLVEDAAESHGARYRGRLVGQLGDTAAFSFFGNKIITTGEGGMVTTNDDALAARVRMLRGQGMQPDRRYWHPIIGYNYRMTNLCAAIGLAQLERMDEALAARRRVAGWYRHFLSGVDGLALPHVEPWAEHAYWMFTVLLNDSVFVARDDVMARLDFDGIETRPIFFPMHQLPPYHDKSRSYVHADRCSARGINLPTHVRLTETDIRRICDSLINAIKS